MEGGENTIKIYRMNFFLLKKRLREDIVFRWRGGVFLEMNER